LNQSALATPMLAKQRGNWHIRATFPAGYVPVPTN
jgi:hypothetical protein